MLILEALEIIISSERLILKRENTVNVQHHLESNRAWNFRPVFGKRTYLAKLRWFLEPEGLERSSDPPGSPFRWNWWGTQRISQGNLTNSMATVSMCSCSEWILSLPREWPFPRSKCQGRWTWNQKNWFRIGFSPNRCQSFVKNHRNPCFFGHFVLFSRVFQLLSLDRTKTENTEKRAKFKFYFHGFLGIFQNTIW